MSMPGPWTRVEEMTGKENEKVDLVPVRNWKLLKAFGWRNKFKLMPRVIGPALKQVKLEISYVPNKRTKVN